MFEFLKFEIEILQMTSDQKTYNIKVVDLEKIWNFVGQNCFIWIRLESQISNLISG